MSYRMSGLRRAAACMGALAIALVLSVCGFARGASAVERVDTDRSASLTLQATCGEAPVEGMEFSLYRVAGFNSLGAFEATDDFSGCNVDFTGLEHASDWLHAAQDYVGYVDAEHIDAQASDTTGATGRVGFTDLVCGLYLVRGAVLEADGVRYTPAPYLVSVPYRAEGSETWEYDVASDVKVESEKLPAKPASGQEDGKEGSASKNPLAHLAALAKTGDTTAVAILLVLVAGVAALVVGIILAVRRRRCDR